MQVDEDQSLALWEAVRAFALREANRWARGLGGRRGVTADDLEQVAFVAVLDTLERWKPELGAFSTLYGYRLKDALSTACGYRTRRELNDPINNYVAIDSPLTDDFELTLADVIPDASADIEEQYAADDLRDAVAAALERLPENERAAIVAEFWHGQRGEAKTRAAALRHLRHPSISKELRAFVARSPKKSKNDAQKGGVQPLMKKGKSPCGFVGKPQQRTRGGKRRSEHKNHKQVFARR